TERLLERAGASVTRRPHSVSVRGASRLALDEVDIPGDFSSAAPLLVAAAIVPGSDLTVHGVGLNPRRIGLLDVLERMGDAAIVDAMTGALHDPFGHGHMGITAENIAAKYGITREDQDRFALESHRRAANALEKGYFAGQIVPVEVKTKKGPVAFTVDEHVRKDAKIEDMQKLRPAFKKDGTVTAGNASGINDAAAAVVMMEGGAAQERGLKPLARLVAYAHAGVDPQVMGLGPIPAGKRVFENAGLKPSDMDVVESNEAFAVQAMAVTRDLGLDPAKVNPNGGAVALGHPIGATGCILTVKALSELARTGKRYALVTMCIGGGQGIAAMT
ncbi:MAG: acetyl-CoA C-acyltransferase, partial [Chloroflexi bacterium]|nr:acetyl-CoA C-acyltransferase [Chloroflexota bacterium]